MYTFQVKKTDRDRVVYHHEFVVKDEFLSLCKNPQDYSPLELHLKFNITTYLHNPEGPANTDYVRNLKWYWIDGLIKGTNKDFSYLYVHDENDSEELRKIKLHHDLNTVPELKKEYDTTLAREEFNKKMKRISEE